MRIKRADRNLLNLFKEFKKKFNEENNEEQNLNLDELNFAKG